MNHDSSVSWRRGRGIDDGTTPRGLMMFPADIDNDDKGGKRRINTIHSSSVSSSSFLTHLPKGREPAPRRVRRYFQFTTLSLPVLLFAVRFWMLQRERLTILVPSSPSTTTTTFNRTSTGYPSAVVYRPWPGSNNDETGDINQYSWCCLPTMNAQDPQTNKTTGFLFHKLYKTASSTGLSVHLRIAEQVGRRLQHHHHHVGDINGTQSSSSRCMSHYLHDFVLRNERTNYTVGPPLLQPNNNNDEVAIDHLNHQATSPPPLQPPSFLWTTLRYPTSRSISSYLFYHVSLNKMRPPFDVRHFLDYMDATKNQQFLMTRNDPHRPILREDHGLLYVRNASNNNKKGKGTPYSIEAITLQEGIDLHNNVWEYLSKESKNSASNVAERRSVPNGGVHDDGLVDEKDHQLEQQEKLQHLLRTQVLQSHSFIALTERWEESMVVLQLLLGLEETDVLSFRSKSAQSWSWDWTVQKTVTRVDPITHETHNIHACFKIVPKQRVQDLLSSPKVQTYLKTDFVRGNADFVLYEMANASLDATIDVIGRIKVERLVERHRWWQQTIQQECAHRVTFPCSSNGTWQTESVLNCYERDAGCGHECIDKVVARTAPSDVVPAT